HCLQRRGWTDRAVLLCLSGICLLTVFGALASAAVNSEVLALIAAAAVVIILAFARLFGNAEFHLVRQRFSGLVASFVPWRPDGIPLLVRGQLAGRLEVTGFRGDEPAGRKVEHMFKLAEQVEQAVSELTAARNPALTDVLLDEPAPVYAFNGLAIDRAEN